MCDNQQSEHQQLSAKSQLKLLGVFVAFLSIIGFLIFNISPKNEALKSAHREESTDNQSGTISGDVSGAVSGGTPNSVQGIF